MGEGSHVGSRGQVFGGRRGIMSGKKISTRLGTGLLPRRNSEKGKLTGLLPNITITDNAKRYLKDER